MLCANISRCCQHQHKNALFYLSWIIELCRNVRTLLLVGWSGNDLRNSVARLQLLHTNGLEDWFFFWIENINEIVAKLRFFVGRAWSLCLHLLCTTTLVACALAPLARVLYQSPQLSSTVSCADFACRLLRAQCAIKHMKHSSSDVIWHKHRPSAKNKRNIVGNR